MKNEISVATGILSLIEQLHPQNILELGPQERRVAEEFCLARGLEYRADFALDMVKAPPKKRFDLAIVHLDQRVSSSKIPEFVGLLKNYWSDHIWVFSDKSHNNFAEHYLAMGFRKEKTSDRTPYLRYSYNLDNYNRKRDWNNSRFWANPENWHKRF